MVSLGVHHNYQLDGSFYYWMMAIVKTSLLTIKMKTRVLRWWRLAEVCCCHRDDDYPLIRISFFLENGIISSSGSQGPRTDTAYFFIAKFSF
jgi:hypothetical protein